MKKRIQFNRFSVKDRKFNNKIYEFMGFYYKKDEMEKTIKWLKSNNYKYRSIKNNNGYKLYYKR